MGTFEPSGHYGHFSALCALFGTFGHFWTVRALWAFSGTLAVFCPLGNFYEFPNKAHDYACFSWTDDGCLVYKIDTLEGTCTFLELHILIMDMEFSRYLLFTANF